MKSAIISLSALALSIAACGPADQRADADQSAVGTTKEDVAMAESGGPFDQAEKKMEQQMMAAIGSDAGQSWAVKMIAHHQGAIDMSQIMLQQNPEADVAKMAREAIEKNKKDTADIRKLVKEGAPDQASADLYQPAMMEMKQQMMGASGRNVSETFMRKMLAHHNGAVAMSDVALANGVTGAVRSQVQKTRNENMKDAKMTESMLRGEPMKEPSKKADAANQSSITGLDSNAKSSNRAAVAPAKQKTAMPPAENMEGHDMNDM